MLVQALMKGPTYSCNPESREVMQVGKAGKVTLKEAPQPGEEQAIVAGFASSHVR